MHEEKLMEWWILCIAEFGFQNADCGQFTGTAEAQKAQSKPNEDSLTSKKYRNTFDLEIKGFLLFTRIISAPFAVRNNLI